ncbi:fumarylacetoacetate hydrolase family protein [Microbulbifer elongatus]|uniref:fumarylacetoacetate hydrolase family protein n=1 Tax=Microbulbifer elongatus TaxID=86173 RepID=UPI001CFEEF7B|nr:fumarylacetoacetate hydrolase family protein [Microbulbifer elongatus]
MKFLARTVIVLITVSLCFVAYSFYVSRPAVDTAWEPTRPQVIADPAAALTFARTGSSLIRVMRHNGDTIEGIDITAELGDARDLIEAYAQLGYEGLEKVTGPEVVVPVTELTVPADFHYPHVAAGTNYYEHAKEVYLDDPPFLFPKLSQASAWNHPVDFHPRLDFEAELAMVPLSDIGSPEDQVEYALILCNDFTDRWTLLRQLDLRAPMGTTGFAAGKGRPSFLPTGYLLVIPKSASFYQTISLELAVNGEARQRFTADQMILNVDEIVHQAFAQAARTFFDGDEQVELLPKHVIPRGTLILTGTAAGVLFKPANVWNQGFYLQRGDQVVTRATYLGHLENHIE